VVGLLVPENANEFHLQILAGLAELLNEAGLRERLLQADSAEQVIGVLRSAASG